MIEEVKEEPKKKDDSIPKKVAAVEIVKHLRTQKILGIGIIAGVFITAIFSIWHKYAGAAAAGILSIFAAFFVKRAMNNIAYLQQKYNLPRPKPMVSVDMNE